MATSFPAGWHVDGGVIGTDIDTSTTSLSGGISVHFPSGGSGNVILYSDWVAIPNRTDTGYTKSATLYYSAAVILQASSVATNKDVLVELEIADQTRSSLGTFSIRNAPLANANAWEPVGEFTTSLGTAAGRWVRFKISRPTDTDFDLYIDSVELKQVPVSKHATTVSGGSFTGTWTSVVFDFGYWAQYVTRTTATNRYDIHMPGLYQINGSVTITDAVANGDIFGIRLRFAQNSISTVQYRYGSTLSMGAAYTPGDTLALTVSATGVFDGLGQSGGVPFTSGWVELQVVQSAGTLVTFDDAHLDVTRITDR